MLSLWEEWFGPQVGRYFRSDCFILCYEIKGCAETEFIADEAGNLTVVVRDKDGNIMNMSPKLSKDKFNLEEYDHKRWGNKCAYIIPKKQ